MQRQKSRWDIQLAEETVCEFLDQELLSDEAVPRVRGYLRNDKPVRALRLALRDYRR